MSITTKFAFTFILNAALAVLINSILFGWTQFTDKLGGVKSFAGLVALIVLALVILGGLAYLMIQDYEGQRAKFVRDLVIAFLVALVLAGIGYSWFSLPDGAGAKVLACLVALVAVSGIEVAVCRRPEN